MKGVHVQEQHMAGLGYERNIYNYRGPGRSGQDHTEELLKEYLEKKGYDVLITRDPGEIP